MSSGTDSQIHQFSYVLPYSILKSEGQKARGIGDVLLNYRYQALFESAVTPAFAPRISLVLPTGNFRKGTGNGSFGVQGSLPFSKVVSDRVTLHANAGATSLFDVSGRSPMSFNLGGSAVYAVTRDFNVLLETVGERIETVNATRGIDREYALTISPGARYAFNLPDTQIVLGLGAPITFSRDKRPSYGAIFYLSVEPKILQ
ncbi:transporter [Bosea eneae]|uniref:Transporter n=1 Tax=Bosea eneae TaxID=151454 RepID=A0ABW0J2F2_9HYPH